MKHQIFHGLLMAAALFAGTATAGTVRLGGAVGAADALSAERMRNDPYTSLPWLRADLTSEQVTEFDNKYSSVWYRPFKHFSGDISGRFIEIEALNQDRSPGEAALLKDLLAELPKHRREGGYFSAYGDIDWSAPIDYKAKARQGPDAPRMMPGLWGNARMLCGLVAAARSLDGEQRTLASEAACKLGDFYIDLLPRMTDPAKMDEYRGGNTYASGYVTCYFPAMEGLVQLYEFCGDRRYLDTAVKMAAFYREFDRIPIDHAHGMLCCQVSLVMLHETTGDPAYLERVENRWDELVQGGYINPAGGILEKCRPTYRLDEGCALTDWLRLNLELARITGKGRYFEMAERVLHNHFLLNQASNGGFGHRKCVCDDTGVVGFDPHLREARWCCNFHGRLAFLLLRRYLADADNSTVAIPYALDFEADDGTGKISSTIEQGDGKTLILSQHIRLEDGQKQVVRIRKPDWADTLEASGPDGAAIDLKKDGIWMTTAEPVDEVTIAYHGGVRVEDRLGRPLDEPQDGFVLRFGPMLLGVRGAEMPVLDGPPPSSLAELEALGIGPLVGPGQACRFLFRQQ